MADHGALGYGKKPQRDKYKIPRPSRLTFGEIVKVMFNFLLYTIIFDSLIVYIYYIISYLIKLIKFF